MKFTSAAALIACTSLLSAQDPTAEASTPQTVWFADFDKAAEIARKDGKDLFVDFTGSDWCGWCKKLDAEVFEHDEFLKPVQENFVLVALDFPRAEDVKALVPNPDRNQELAAKHGVGGYPTVLLMTPDEVVFGRTGYQEGGAAPYADAVETMRTEGKKAVQEIAELVQNFDGAAEGEARSAVLKQAVERLAGMSGDAIGVESVAKIVKTGVSAEDLSVQEECVGALLRSGQHDEDCVAKAAAFDPKNEKGLFELVVRAKMMQVRDDDAARSFLADLDKLVGLGAKDSEVFEGLLARATVWSAQNLKDEAAAKKWAELLKKHAKDQGPYQAMLDQILGSEEVVEEEEVTEEEVVETGKEKGGKK